jgi:predicted alpha/beta-hydrolase family hydrolase
VLFDGPEDARHTVVLAHGAGAPMDSPYMETVTAGLAAHDIRVVRFEFAYMAARRTDGKRRAPDREPVLRAAWKGVVEALGGGEELVIGGKSMGGRMASLVVDEVSARGLLCLGYPFHPPGRPERLRTTHLEKLETPALVLQGTRDPSGSPPRSRATRSAPASRSPGSTTATTTSSRARNRAVPTSRISPRRSISPRASSRACEPHRLRANTEHTRWRGAARNDRVNLRRRLQA